MRHLHSARHLLLVLLVSIGATPLAAQDERGRDITLADAPGGHFALTRADGGQLDLRDLRGRVVVLSFGFTSCQNACPVTLERLARLQERLGKEAGRLQILLVSIDPERDTTAHLRTYLQEFQPELGAPFIGLTGTPEKIRAAADLYHVRYLEHDGQGTAGPTYQHTESIFVIDPLGRLQAAFRPDAPIDVVEAEVRRHLPVLSTTAAHTEYEADVDASIAVGGAWVRSAPPVTRSAAAYAVLRNRGDLDDWLIGASSPDARVVEIHGMERQGDTASMRRVEHVAIPAREVVALAPGGFHLMLIDLQGPLDPGGEVKLRLEFANAGAVEVRAPVR